MKPYFKANNFGFVVKGLISSFLCASTIVPAAAGAGFTAGASLQVPGLSSAIEAPLVPAPEAPAFPLVYARSSGKITVGINPNRELLYTILHLTRYSEKLRRHNADPLVGEVLKEFAPYAGHPAVAELDADGRLNWEQGFCYDAFSSFPGHFSALPEGRRLHPYAEDFLARVLRGMSREQKIEYLDAYWEKVMDFYRKSGFDAFFRKQAPAYRAYADGAFAALPAANPVKLHEEYHANYAFEHFYIVPSPLNLPTGGNYGWNLGNSIFNFMGYGFSDPEAVNYLSLHEFGHSFCNPVVEEFAGALAPYAGLMAGIKDEMQGQAYGQWLTVMYELLVRSVHTRFVLKTEGPQAAELFLLDNAFKRKFVFIKDFYDALAVYEADRGRYPTLYEFYPKMVKIFDGWELAEVEEAADPGVWSEPAGGGVKITGVASANYAYACGLRWGDLVTAVDGVEPARDFFYTLAPGRAYALAVTRKDGGQAVVNLVVPAQKKLRPVKKTDAPAAFAEKY